MTIWFDMDGTIANLYAVDNWLPMLRAEDPTPYKQAAVMLNMSKLARQLHKLQAMGFEIGIISWLSKVSSPNYSRVTTAAKNEWLNNHLPSVEWDEIIIVEYGTPKQSFATSDDDILFDDEEKNRNNWTGKAYSPDKIFEVLKELQNAE